MVPRVLLVRVFVLKVYSKRKLWSGSLPGFIKLYLFIQTDQKSPEWSLCQEHPRVQEDTDKQSGYKS